MSQTPNQFLARIQIAKRQGLKELDLSSLPAAWYSEKLTSLPSEVLGLEWLEVLNLSHNSLTALPDSLEKLPNLIKLDLSDNQLTALPASLKQLPKLTELDLSRNYLTTLPNWLGQLRNLTRFGLGSNFLSSLPDSLGQLSNLSILDSKSNQLISLPDSLGQLYNLTLLYLGSNQLTTLPNSLKQLSKLIELDLTLNRLVSLPDWLGQLSNLTALYLGSNQLTELPDCLGQLYNLTQLNFSNNHLTTIPISVGLLPNLTELHLSGNPLESPPLEVVERGIRAIRNYFWQLEQQGQDYLYEAKLLIVGEAGAGKTTLAKKIENPIYELRDEDSTKGIEVVQWSFNLDNRQSFRVNIWDFGGQEIYKSTHQFFLTKRSLYTLVADTRKEDTDFYYWLNIVELLSDNSPLLIIKNEKQDRQREINERQLHGQFTNLERTLATNLATNRGLSEILAEIKHLICRLPHIGTPLPKTWVKIRGALENDPRNYISLDEYLTICQQHDFTQLEDKLQLSSYLHDLGVCLHFQEDALLKKTVILKPEWGTAAVYKVLDNKTVINNLGRFSRADLKHIWCEEQYTGMQDELLQLMMKFKLCYQIPSTQDTYIVPQLLTENQPEYDWDEADNLKLRYTYEFMPKGILTQFIVTLHRLITEQNYVWKSGVVLQQDGAKAQVIEHYGKREITVRVVGKRKKELLTIVTYELDKIHDSYLRLKYDKLVPCNCTACNASQEPHYYRFEILRKFADEGYPHIQCLETGEMIKVLDLIDEVMDREWLSQCDYNFGRIRTLLTEGFSDAELRQFCYDEPMFKPVYAELAPTAGLAEVVNKVLQYAERRELMETLLGWAKAKNPAKYEKFKPYKRETPP